MIDPKMKFKRKFRGYHPQEVDAVFDEFLRQGEKYKNQIRALQDTVNKYDGKIALLAQITRQLEEVQQKEKLKISEMVIKVSYIAEQIELEARQKAMELIDKAQKEADRLKETVR